MIKNDDNVKIVGEQKTAGNLMCLMERQENSHNQKMGKDRKNGTATELKADYHNKIPSLRDKATNLRLQMMKISDTIIAAKTTPAEAVVHEEKNPTARGFNNDPPRRSKRAHVTPQYFQ